MCPTSSGSGSQTPNGTLSHLETLSSGPGEAWNSLHSFENLTGHREHGLQESLWSCGIVAVLTTVSRALSRSNLPPAAFVLKGFSAILFELLLLSPPVWVPESLRTGLLEIVFASQRQEQLSRCLVTLLEDVLLPATVYHSVLVEIRIALPQVYDHAALFDDAFFSHCGGALYRACDQCARICPKQELKCCTGCLTSNYCSKACQANDWQYNGHRQTCADLLLRRAQCSHISTKNRSFLRALVHHEYTTRRNEIAQTHRQLAKVYPGEVLCTTFDFTTGLCKMQVWPLEYLRSGFEFDVERAMKSDGQIELRLLKVRDGHQFRMRPFPLHLRCAAIDPAYIPQQAPAAEPVQ
ncbi:hypothetical protein C8R45DRAFT_931900 [Mycena sanguinolenta]|nr:hypothetical protein C8R45DRAFT_931900 [Mycena sanguinolenta]